MKKKSVLLVGETWMITKFHTKGFDVVPLGGYEDYSVFLKRGLDMFKDIEITHIPNHLVLSLYPQTMEQISGFDTVIISDCGRNTLTMYPDMFKVPMGPDRVKLTADYVRQGGSLVMAGGWVCFQGFQGKGNYHGSEIEEVLPVNIMETDDRVECTGGVTPTIINPGHRILDGISGDWPKFLGYQRVFAKQDSALIATIGDREDPFIVAGTPGKGKSLVFTSDLAPHWGTDFVDWEDYGRFWHNVIGWLTE